MPITPSDMDEVLKNEVEGPRKNNKIRLHAEKVLNLLNKFSQQLKDINIPKQNHRQICEMAISTADHLTTAFSIEKLKENPLLIKNFAQDDAVSYYMDNDSLGDWEDPDDPSLIEMSIRLKRILIEMMQYIINQNIK